MNVTPTRTVLLAVVISTWCQIVSQTAQAQPITRPQDASPSNAKQVSLPPIDRAAIQADDLAREQLGAAPRYAIPHTVAITPQTHGSWEDLPRESRLWRLQIAATDALSINLGFGQYFMPEGGQLVVRASDGSQAIRPFTSEDNASHGELWTPPVISDDIVVEVTIPRASEAQLQLELTSINYGYRGFGEPNLGGLRSGSCNVDVVCPDGIGWELEIASVAVISTGGGTFCTGFMVNNTAQDLKPYFMTAAHCGIGAGNAASLVTFWNYQNSTCRPPGSGQSGGAGNGSLSQFQTGAFFRSSFGSSDFTLVELDQDPDPAWAVGYAGWDRSGAEATTAIAIHHPNTDEKRISFEFQPTTTTTYLQSSVPGDSTHVRVADWDTGTTEPGSSGSPLFDQDHRVIGQLHGGFAACGNNDDDWYGRISRSWNGGGTPSSRLSDWLDTGATGATTVDTISLATLCSDQGTVEFAEASHACEGTATIRVVDCGLNLNPLALDTVSVNVSSDSEPGGESVILTELSLDTGQFEGSITLSETDGAGVVLVSASDTLTVTYIDADDGLGGVNVPVMNTASMDCTAPIISNVASSNIQPRAATVTFNVNELADGIVRYGLSCGSFIGSQSSATRSTSPSVDLTGLNDDTTYFYEAQATDVAGNSSTDDNGSACYTFSTPSVPDFFTEEFGSDNDLDNQSIIFTPNGSVDFYGWCAEPIAGLPTDPTGGTAITLGDDDSALVTLTGGSTVSMYGTSYSSFFVGSNGYITFGTGDSDYTETLGEHFGPLPRVSVLFDDLSPNQAGTVSWKQLPDRAVVTWLNVPEFNASNSNTIQAELFFDGTIAINYGAVAAADGIAGLSDGSGLSPDFTEMDLTVGGTCGAQPPVQASGVHAAEKNRYISFAPNNGTELVNFQIEMLDGPGLPGVVGWVGTPDIDGIATVVASPPNPPLTWRDPVVHVKGCQIVPTGNYAIRATSDNVIFSADFLVDTIPLPVDGRFWADVVGTFDSMALEWTPPNGSVNGFDVNAILKKFELDPTAPHITWVDLNPLVPDGVANGNDVLQAVNGFGLTPYPFVSPDNCP